MKGGRECARRESGGECARMQTVSNQIIFYLSDYFSDVVLC